MSAAAEGNQPPASGDSSTSSGTTPAPSTATTATSQTSSTPPQPAAAADESLQCKWGTCTERFNAAEVLYVSPCREEIWDDDEKSTESAARFATDLYFIIFCAEI